MKYLLFPSSLCLAIISCLSVPPRDASIEAAGVDLSQKAEPAQQFEDYKTAVAPPQQACRDDQVHVVGEYCPELETKCLEWIDKVGPEANSGIGPLRCARFQYPTRCLSRRTVHKDFCIDRYEWPNVKGELPPIGMTYWEAKSLCESVDKRLCTISEATLACEGPERKPYPYGYERDDTACNIDRPSADPKTSRDKWPDVYRGVPSGSMERCVSDYGVYDMTGNVDEWTHNESGKPFVSALRSGYWGPVRARCRPVTYVHGPEFSFYQIGFRCCSDISMK